MIQRKIISATVLSFLLTFGILLFEGYRSYSVKNPLLLSDYLWLIFIMILYIYPITFCYSILVGICCEVLLKTPLTFLSFILHIVGGILFMFLASFYYNYTYLLTHFSQFLQEAFGYILISVASAIAYWLCDCFLYTNTRKKNQWAEKNISL